MSQSFVGASRVGLASLVVAVGFTACSGDEAGGGGVSNIPMFGAGNGGSNGQTNNPGNVPGPGTSGAGAGAGAGSGDTNQPGVVTPGAGGGAMAPGAGGASMVADTAEQPIPASFFESGAWRGFAWTGAEAANLNIGTTRLPLDFSMVMGGQPFCIQGSVGSDLMYRGVALLGFNVHQEPFGAAAGVEAVIGETVPTQAGIAVNFTKTQGQTLRIQLQNAAGQIWCAELSKANGPAFVPYTVMQDPGVTTPEERGFRTECWLAPGAMGYANTRPYNREPISAVVLTIPGTNMEPDLPYNVCMTGFADGNGLADAPSSISLTPGILTGTMSQEAARTRVTGADGKTYIINNNAWGDNSSDGSQQLRYTGNSFEILRQSAGPGGNSSPASFPSIYIGANGAQSGVNGGTTSSDDSLPKRIADITSIQTTFNHSGPLGDNNATYDVWFAPNPPAGTYDTAQGAFLMVWTHKPNGRNPIGVNNAPFQRGITVAGVPGTWDLWVGPRGGGGPDANLPVINYVAPTTIRNFTFDLKRFIDDAVTRSPTFPNGLRFSNQLFLTDVFAGFEIWSGGAGLRVDKFSAVVQ